MTIDEALDQIGEILRLVRERKLAGQPRLAGHRNDRLRQEAYRWAREHGFIRARTIAKLALRLNPSTRLVRGHSTDVLIRADVMAAAARLGWTKPHPLPLPQTGSVVVFHLRPPARGGLS